MRSLVSLVFIVASFAGCLGGAADDSGEAAGERTPGPQKAIAFTISGSDGSQYEALAVPQHTLRTHATGHPGFEPTVRSTGDSILMTGSAEVIRSEDGTKWDVVQSHPATNDPVMAWDPVAEQAIKVDLDMSLSCAYVSTSSPDGREWTQHPQACSTTMDYLKVAAGPPGPDDNPLATESTSVIYICANLYPFGSYPIGNPCMMSYDGGETFVHHTVNPTGSGPDGACGGITSYPAVSPNGIVILPVHSSSCSRITLLMSRDSGFSWTHVQGPEPANEGSMVAVDFDEDRLVVFWLADNAPRLAWTGDMQTWSPTYTLELPGLEPHFNTLQAHDGVADVAFLGRNGSDWRMHIASIPLEEMSSSVAYRVEDPAQRGAICTNGLGCTGGRNLAEFITSTIHQGDFVVGWTDGCVGCPEGEQSDDRMLTVTRMHAEQG